MTDQPHRCLRCKRLSMLLQQAINTKDSALVHRITLCFDNGDKLMEFVSAVLVDVGCNGVPRIGIDGPPRNNANEANSKGATDE